MIECLCFDTAWLVATKGEVIIAVSVYFEVFTSNAVKSLEPFRKLHGSGKAMSNIVCTINSDVVIHNFAINEIELYMVYKLCLINKFAHTKITYKVKFVIKFEILKAKICILSEIIDIKIMLEVSKTNTTV